MGNANCKSSTQKSTATTTITTTIAAKNLTVPSSIADDDFAIPIKIYTSLSENQPTLRAAVLFIHGGVFHDGDCNSHPTIANGLANLGLVVITASFRNGKEAPHKSNITNLDLKDVVDYIQKTWKNLPFGIVGSSSGGFFALTLSQSLGPYIVKFCIPICPVADPFKRASYLRSSISGSAKSDGYNIHHDVAKSRQILSKQLSFWKDDDSMQEAGGSLSNPKHENIPTLMIIGSVDKNVPFSVTADVQTRATRTIVIGGKGHEICDKLIDEEGGGYHCYLHDIDRFVEYVLSVKE